MNPRALFGLSTLMSFYSFGRGRESLCLAKASNNGPWRRARSLSRTPYVSSYHWTRLLPGVVSPSLPAAFAAPAYGDFVAGILAILGTLALAKRASWAIVLVWVFNVWGAGDLLIAIYQGNIQKIDPGALGAAFYILTAVVPSLLVTHALIFLLLLRPKTS